MKMKLSTTISIVSAALAISSADAFAIPGTSSSAASASSTIHIATSTHGRHRAIARPPRMSQEDMDLITMDAGERMDKTMSNLADNLMTVRTGRANPSMLDRVEAEYYGASTPISQMATISVPSSQQLQITPFDKSSIASIEKAIIYAGLGFTPTSDGNVIRINIPQLTEERRKDLLKQCKSIGEEAKVAIRNIRRDGVDAMKKMEKTGDIGKDQALDGIDAIQKLTDDHIKLVDERVGKKEKEVATL
jgi:ribosome recycling factor